MLNRIFTKIIHGFGQIGPWLQDFFCPTIFRKSIFARSGSFLPLKKVWSEMLCRRFFYTFFADDEKFCVGRGFEMLCRRMSYARAPLFLAVCSFLLPASSFFLGVSTIFCKKATQISLIFSELVALVFSRNQFSSELPTPNMKKVRSI